MQGGAGGAGPLLVPGRDGARAGHAGRHLPQPAPPAPVRLHTGALCTLCAAPLGRSALGRRAPRRWLRLVARLMFVHGTSAARTCCAPLRMWQGHSGWAATTRARVQGAAVVLTLWLGPASALQEAPCCVCLLTPAGAAICSCAHRARRCRGAAGAASARARVPSTQASTQGCAQVERAVLHGHSNQGLDVEGAPAQKVDRPGLARIRLVEVEA